MVRVRSTVVDFQDILACFKPLDQMSLICRKADKADAEFDKAYPVDFRLFENNIQKTGAI